MILTNFGGVQEEAAAIGRPTLVLREKTQRIEGVEASVGLRTATIVGETLALLADRSGYEAMRRALASYGDVRAAERIVKVVPRRSGR